MTALKLIALDEEDLAVLSAHLQDAVVKVSDLAYLPGEKRFAALFNRFDWAAAVAAENHSTSHRRVRSALRFERVLSARLQHIDLSAKTRVLCLLAIGFEPGKTPGGSVTMIFAGGGAIKLEVECIEAELRDLGGAWRAKGRPRHASESEPGSEAAPADPTLKVAAEKKVTEPSRD